MELGHIADLINRNHTQANKTAEKAIEHAKTCGALLLQVKEVLAHGMFEKWVEESTYVRVRQARKYMQLVNLLKSAPGADLTEESCQLTINSAIKELSKQVEGDKPKPDKPKPDKPKQPEPEKNEPRREKPVSKPEEQQHNYVDEHELRTMADELLQENEVLLRVTDASDSVTQALEEVKRIRAENQVLKSQLEGKTNESNALARQLKACKKRITELEKELAKANEQIAQSGEIL